MLKRKLYILSILLSTGFAGLLTFYFICFSECRYGHWTCTDELCPAVCSIVGYQSVTTLDGESFKFVPADGECAYSLIKVFQKYLVNKLVDHFYLADIGCFN